MQRRNFKELQNQVEDILHEFMLSNNEYPYQSFFVGDVVNQFIVEIMKMEYDLSSMKNATSFRQQILNDAAIQDNVANVGFQVEKEKISRMFKHIKENREKEASALEYLFGYFPEELRIEDISGMKAKIQGYKVSQVQYTEIQNMIQYEIFLKAANGQIGKSKNVSNEKFVEMYGKYDELIKNIYHQIEESDSEELLVKNTFAYFVIQWKQPLEWVYKIADAVEAAELSEKRVSRLGLYCMPYNEPENDFHADNRFLISRNRYFDMLCYSDENEIPYIEWLYKHQLYALQYLKDAVGESVLEEMKKFTLIEKSDFIRQNYWIWNNMESKYWTNKKIKIARLAFNSFNSWLDFYIK